jgi:hypothetical protein
MKQKWHGQQKGQPVVVAAVGVGFLLPEEQKPDSWWKPFEHGSVRVIFYVEKNPIKNSYRVLVANRGYKPDERQWFDADDIPNAIRSLQDAQKAQRRAKRYLEGGMLRRMIRTLF